MMIPVEICPLQAVRIEELKEVMTGYTSTEKYAVSKTEQETGTRLQLELVKLPHPYTRHFDQEISTDDLDRYIRVIAEGLSLGCRQGDRLVGVAIAEACHWNRILWIHEFHIAAAVQGQGLGRQLMNVLANMAIQKDLRAMQVETQNTNVPAIRFYRRVGYTIEAVDLSYYTNNDVDDYEVAVFMRRKLISQPA